MDPRKLGTVTVLFTDVVGSTEGRRHLGDSRAEQLREIVDSAQVEAIERHEGRVVKGTGDGIMAVFMSAGGALAAAAEIVARTRAATNRGATPIELRVGLSAGDVSQVGEDVFGTPVVEAARLCAAASGDEILLSDVVRTLAGSWSEFPLIERGDVELSGLGSVQHWSLDWTDASIPTPAGIGILVDEEFPFVGRVEELRMLQEMWTGVTRGKRGAALVVGEAGVGKTRLIVEMARSIRLGGGLVLSGRCEEGVTAPLLPFHGAIDMYVRSHDVDIVRANAGPFLGELTRHFPELAASVGEAPGTPDPDPEAERWRLLAGITRLLREAAVRQSVALIIDDLQWADVATRSFVEQILREADLGAIGIFITSRDTADDLSNEIAEWLARLERLPRVQSLQLHGLDAVDLRSLVEQSRVDVDAESIWEQTEGHPFFVSELVRYARESHGRPTGVPRSIEGLLESRVGRLPSATIDLLTAGAVAGSEFDLGLAREIAELAEDEAVLAAEEAVAARLLIEIPDRFDRYQFTHRLIADVITAHTSMSRRTRIHRDLAAALQRRGESSAEVARHLLAAAPLVGIDEAVDATRRAAREAITRGSPDQATSLLERALELAVDPIVRIDLELEVGSALNFAGRAAAAVPWFERAAAGAIEQDEFDQLAKAALGCWAGSPWIANLDRTAPKLLRAALERCPENDVISRARLQAGLAAFSIFSAPLQERDQVTAEAVAVARSSGDAAALAATLVSRHIAINCPLAVDEVDRIDRELAKMSTSANSAFPQLLDVPVASVFDAGFAVGVSGPRYWRADGRAYRAAADSFDLDDPRTPDLIATLGYQLRAGVAILDGRLADAGTASDLAAEIGGWGDSSAGNHMWQRLVIDWLDGDIEASHQRVADLYERFGGQPMRCTLAWVEAATGNETGARELLERVRIDRLHRLPELFLGTIGLATCAMAVWHLGDRRWADAVVSAFQPVFELLCGVPWTPLPSGYFFVALMHTLLGDPRAADEAFSAATLVHERLGAPAFVALTKAAHGRALAEVDPQRAGDLLAEAQHSANTLGLAGVAGMTSAKT